MSAYRQRIERIRAELDRVGADALLVSQPESRYYLSGYTGHDLPPRDSAGYLLISHRKAYLLTDPRTSEQAEKQSPDYEVAAYGNVVSAPDKVGELAKQDGLKRIAFESVHLPYLIARKMREALQPDAELVETTDVVDRLRISKDEQELIHLRAAVDVLDECMAHVVSVLRPGRTELEIAAEVERFLRDRGSEPSFPSIVASGPNASMPHAVPTERRIQAHEPVTIDIGARSAGYASDMTRTVCMGQPSSRLAEIYDLVLRAQESAERAIRPGMTGREADAVARRIIEEAGFGNQFNHGTGHGIGLEVHEPPWLSPARGDTVLEPGMVFSVEPGVYIPGWGGVRIEDLVLLTAQGAEVLSRSPKTLQLAEVQS